MRLLAFILFLQKFSTVQNSAQTASMYVAKINCRPQQIFHVLFDDVWYRTRSHP